MKRHLPAIGLAVATLMGTPSPANAQPTSAPSGQGEDRQTAVISAQVSSRSASAPLEMRVSVQYVNSTAGDILQVLAKAAGLTVEVPSATLKPVTLTLTNVRLRTALGAICDTADCAWRLEGTIIKVTATAPSGGGGLPPLVSLALEEVAVPDVFRAIGAAVGVQVLVEGHVDRPPVTVKFTNSPTNAVMDRLCKAAGCTWEFDSGSRQLRVRFHAP